MSARLPFRTHLVPYSPNTSEELDAYTDALTAIATRESLSTEDFLKLAKHPSEEVRWLLWTMHGTWAKASEFPAKEREELCDRALAEARDKGVLWTPMMDALAKHSIFHIAWNNNRRKQKEWGLDSNENGFDYQLALRLAPWIRSQTDPRALHPLLKFQSRAILKVLAGEMPVADEELLERLEQYEGSVITKLAQNPHLQTQLAKRWWESYRAATTRGNAEKEQRALNLLKRLVGCGARLPLGVRKAMISHLYGSRQSDGELVQIVLADANPLTIEDIEKLNRHLRFQDAVELVVEGRISADVIDLLIERRDVALRVMESEQALPEILARIHAYHATRVSPKSNFYFEMSRALTENPNTPLETLRILAQTPSRATTMILYKLIMRPECRKDPVIRKCLIDSRRVEIAKAMLPYARTKEYPILLERIARTSKREAIDYLEKHRPPRGTHIPEKLWTNLLSSANSEERLRVITLIGKYGNPSTRRGNVTNPGKASGRKH